MKYRNTEKIELDEYTSGGFLTLDWLDEDKMDEKIYKNLKKVKKSEKKA
tara:strand:+ start:243 stop:389 length:147 start_codon:yes stop_codon:yes gene_type:complete